MDPVRQQRIEELRALCEEINNFPQNTVCSGKKLNLFKQRLEVAWNGARLGDSDLPGRTTSSTEIPIEYKKLAQSVVAAVDRLKLLYRPEGTRKIVPPDILRIAEQARNALGVAPSRSSPLETPTTNRPMTAPPTLLSQEKRRSLSPIGNPPQATSQAAQSTPQKQPPRSETPKSTPQPTPEKQTPKRGNLLRPIPSKEPPPQAFEPKESSQTGTPTDQSRDLTNLSPARDSRQKRPSSFAHADSPLQSSPLPSRKLSGTPTGMPPLPESRKSTRQASPTASSSRASPLQEAEAKINESANNPKISPTGLRDLVIKLKEAWGSTQLAPSSSSLGDVLTMVSKLAQQLRSMHKITGIQTMPRELLVLEAQISRAQNHPLLSSSPNAEWSSTTEFPTSSTPIQQPSTPSDALSDLVDEMVFYFDCFKRDVTKEKLDDFSARLELMSQGNGDGDPAWLSRAEDAMNLLQTHWDAFYERNPTKESSFDDLTGVAQSLQKTASRNLSRSSSALFLDEPITPIAKDPETVAIEAFTTSVNQALDRKGNPDCKHIGPKSLPIYAKRLAAEWKTIKAPSDQLRQNLKAAIVGLRGQCLKWKIRMPDELYQISHELDSTASSPGDDAEDIPTT